MEPYYPCRKKTVEITCAWCGKGHWLTPQKAKTARFCSRQCAGQAQKTAFMRPCAWCGTEREVEPNYSAIRPNIFCLGTDCLKLYNQKHRAGQNSKLYKADKPTAECAVCGKEHVIHPHLLRKNHFCSTPCYAKWRSMNVAGEQHPNFDRDKEHKPCEICGMDMEVLKCRGETQRFCSRACYGTWKSRTQVGPKHPRWKGGVVGARREWVRAGGRLWNALCRRRDGHTCQLCGCVKGAGAGGIHVHHRLSWTKYEHLRSVPLNGICLCGPCHYWVHSKDGSATRKRLEQEVWDLLVGAKPKHRRRQVACTKAQLRLVA